MRNRRLTISALAVVLLTGCGEESGLNPEILGLVGSWNTTTLTYTQVGGANTVVDAFSAGAGAQQVRDQKQYFYDDNKILIITTFIDALAIDPDYEVIDPFEAFVSGDVLSTAPYRQRDLPGTGDPLLEFALIAVVDAACGAAGGLNANGGATAACDVLVFDLGSGSQSAVRFTRSGDDLTITGIVQYDFGAGDEAATINLVLERFIPDTPVQSLV